MKYIIAALSLLLSIQVYASETYQYCKKRSTFQEADGAALSESVAELGFRDVNEMGIYPVTRSEATLTKINGSPQWRVCYVTPKEPTSVGEMKDPLCDWNIFGSTFKSQVAQHVSNLENAKIHLFEDAHVGMPVYLEGQWTNRVHSCLRFQPSSIQSGENSRTVCSFSLAKYSFEEALKDLESKFIASEHFKNLAENTPLWVSVQFEIVKSVILPGAADWRACFVVKEFD